MRLFAHYEGVSEPININQGDIIQLSLDGKVYVYELDGVTQDFIDSPITLRLRDPGQARSES
jgi:hypothetical protein